MVEDIFLNFDFTRLGTIYLIVGIIYFLLIKKAIYAWFDPMFNYFVFNTAAITLVVYLYLLDHINLFYLVTFFSSVIGFIIGLRVGNVHKGSMNIGAVKVESFYNYARILDIFLFLIVSALLVSNGAMFAVKGTIPILSSNPSDAKVLLFEGGWGIVRRFNFIFTTVGLAIILIKLVNPVSKVSYAKRYYLLGSFLLICMILVSTGSKSALLHIVGIFFPVFLINRNLKGLHRSFLFPLNNHLKVIYKITFIALLMAIVYLFIVLFLSYGDGNVLTSLLIRFISAGDTYFFYYVYDLNSSFHETPYSYFLHLFNPILGMLRVVPYDYPIGSYILLYSTDLPLSSFGPNAQHPIEGLVYFGPYFAWLYSLCVGLTISLIRTKWLYTILKKPHQLNLLIYVIISSTIISIATESTLFSTQFFDLLLYGGALFLVSLAINQVLKK